MRESLTVKHVVSQTDSLSTKSQLASLESQLISVKDSAAVASIAIQEAKNHRQDIIAKYNKEIGFEASEIAGQLAEVEKSLVRAQDRVGRLSLITPISGIIQAISITSINTVVKPGNVILPIVPIDGELIVKARILPEDAGHIRIRQPAEIKVDSYDAGKYGYIPAKVKQISPSTYLDEKMNPYYLVRIELEKNHVGNNPELMKPVSQGFSNDFQER